MPLNFFDRLTTDYVYAIGSRSFQKNTALYRHNLFVTGNYRTSRTPPPLHWHSRFGSSSRDIDGRRSLPRTSAQNASSPYPCLWVTAPLTLGRAPAYCSLLSLVPTWSHATGGTCLHAHVVVLVLVLASPAYHSTSLFGCSWWRCSFEGAGGGGGWMKPKEGI